MAPMPCELKVKTLEGGDLTVEVVPTTTIKELRAMLHEKKNCEDPIERKILKVKVLADGLLVDDDQTLESAVRGCCMPNRKWPSFIPETKLKPQQQRQSMQRASSKSTSPTLSQKFLLEPLKTAIR